MTQPTFYRTLKEAAVIMRCNPRTIRRYVAAGELPFVRIGRKYLFRETDLLNLPSARRASREEVLA